MNRTQSILDRDSAVILDKLGVKGLKGNDAAEVVEALLDHFHKVIIETAIVNLPTRNLEKFRNALTSKNLEEEIASLTSRIPGLAEKIEVAVDNEFIVLKAAYEKVK